METLTLASTWVPFFGGLEGQASARICRFGVGDSSKALQSLYLHPRIGLMGGLLYSAAFASAGQVFTITWEGRMSLKLHEKLLFVVQIHRSTN
jgi:hypothetical protein